MRDYSHEILEIIQNVLGTEIGIFLFGSRARDDNQEFSDFDIGLYSKESIDRKHINRIYELLDESTIPFKVDLIDFGEEDADFTKIAIERIKVWQNHSLIQHLIENIKS